MPEVHNPGIDKTVNYGSSENISRAALLENAMRNGKRVLFEYDGKTRAVEVHAIGTSTKDGSLVMRGFQVDGEASRPLPQWTLFTVSKIEQLYLGRRDSEAPRDGYTMGDRQMDVVLAELKI